MSEISEQQERKEYEYLMEKSNNKGKKKLSKKQKKRLKYLSEKYSNNYNPPEKTYEEEQREIERKQQRKFKNSSIDNQIMMIFASIIKGIVKYIRELIIYLSAISTIFYLYYNFENKETSELYKTRPDKFPYVFYDDQLDYDEQKNLTTIDITEGENSYIKPVYVKVGESDDMKKKINQPKGASIMDMDWFAGLFNMFSNDAKSYDINLLQILFHALLSGIIGINTFYYNMHELIKNNLYYTNGKKSNTNGGNLFGGSNQSSKVFAETVNAVPIENVKKVEIVKSGNQSEYYIKNIIGKAFLFFIITVLFFLFRLSKDDLSNLLKPFIDPNVLKLNESIFGLEDLLNLFSSLFSGFFSAYKILFVLSFVIFIVTSLISLKKLSSSISNMSSALIILFVTISYLSSFIFFALYIGGSIKNNTAFSINELFNSIFNIFEKYLYYFKEFVKNNPIGNSLFKSSDNSFGIFSNAITLLSLMFILPFIPILLIFLFAIIIVIVFSFAPIVGSAYMSIKMSYEMIIESIFKVTTFKEEISKKYIPIVLSFALCSIFILNQNKSKNIIELIEGIVVTILTVVTLLYIILIGISNGQGIKELFLNLFSQENSSKLFTPFIVIFIIAFGLIYNLIQTYKSKNSM